LSKLSGSEIRELEALSEKDLLHQSDKPVALVQKAAKRNKQRVESAGVFMEQNEITEDLAGFIKSDAEKLTIDHLNQQDPGKNKPSLPKKQLLQQMAKTARQDPSKLEKAIVDSTESIGSLTPGGGSPKSVARTSLQRS